MAWTAHSQLRSVFGGGIEDGRGTEVLGRLAKLHVATAAYMAAIARHPKRNVTLRHGARTIKRYDGELRPARDLHAHRWSVHFIGGKRMERLGIVAAVDEAGAVEAAAAAQTAGGPILGEVTRP